MGIEQTAKSGTPFLPVTGKNQLRLGTASGVGVGSQENWAPRHKTHLNINNLIVTITDSGGAGGGQGSQLIYTFPLALIQIVAAMYSLTTKKGAGGIAVGGALVGALGTVIPGVGDAALTGTEANIIPSTAGTLVAGVGVLKSFSGTIPAPFDGTAAAIAVFLNLAVPDADISANDTIILNGKIVLFWQSLGDYLL